MKRLFSIVICILILVALTISAHADAINMAGGCKTDVVVKKADPADVKKDGIIGVNEYTEVIFNRDPSTTDLLFSWWDTLEGNPLFGLCEKFLGNVHFYFSWDEVNGLNIAAKATLLETPYQPATQPPAGTGDEFLFQFGMMASVVNEKDPTNDIFYRGISCNTKTDTPIIGDYRSHGHTGVCRPFVAGENYMVTVNGNEVTYEISYPIEAVVEAKNLDGKAPVDGTYIMMNISVTGGSVGNMTEGCQMYAISLGDGGYCTHKAAGDELTPAKVIFSAESIVEKEVIVTTEAVTTEVTTVSEATTPAPTQTVSTAVESVEINVTDGDGNVVTDTDGNTVTEVVTTIVTEAPTQIAGENDVGAPETGDPVIIAAVVAVISACGVTVAKRKK